MSQKDMTPANRQNFGWAYILFGTILAAVALFLYVHQHILETRPPMTSWSVPSSVKPPAKAINTYRVPADNPKYIAIPAIDVGKTRTIQLGVLANGSIAVPDNIYDAGWYGASSKPGQNGAMFVYGHVSSWKANGIFYDLKKLKAGETVIVTNGANKVFTYRVINIKRYAYDKVDMGQVLAPVNPMMAGLNLMTCAGQIIKGTSEFSERLVVFTSLVSS